MHVLLHPIEVLEQLSLGVSPLHNQVMQIN